MKMRTRFGQHFKHSMLFSLSVHLRTELVYIDRKGETDQVLGFCHGFYSFLKLVVDLELLLQLLHTFHLLPLPLSSHCRVYLRSETRMNGEIRLMLREQVHKETPLLSTTSLMDILSASELCLCVKRYVEF